MKVKQRHTLDVKFADSSSSDGNVAKKDGTEERAQYASKQVDMIDKLMREVNGDVSEEEFSLIEDTNEDDDSLENADETGG